MMRGNNTTVGMDSSIDQSIQFILLLMIEVLAMVWTSLILFYFIRNFHRIFTKTLRDHGFFLLTVLSFLYITLDLPFTINSYRLGYDQPRSPLFCRYWYWIDYSIIGSSTFLTVTISIQRHILIFNVAYFNRTYCRYFLHYIPLVSCLLYPTMLYLVLVYIYPCGNSSEEYLIHCAYPCYSSNRILFHIDWMLNTLMPVGGIIVSNTVLIFRVIYSLRKLPRKRPLVLKRQRKLTIELLVISSLYAIGWGPSTIVGVLQEIFLPDLLERIPILNYINYISYFVCPLQPLLYLIISSEMMEFIKNGMRYFLIRGIVGPESLHRWAY